MAVHSVTRAFRYNTVRAKRYRLIRDGNPDGDHIPTAKEVEYLKKRMQQATDKLRKWRQRHEQDKSQENTDKQIAIVKGQVLELNDKFDYLVAMMIKNNGLKVDKVQAMDDDAADQDKEDNRQTFSLD